MKIGFVYSTHSDDVTLDYHPRPQNGSRSRILLNQGNDIIIFHKSKLALNLCNKTETNIYP